MRRRQFTNASGSRCCGATQEKLALARRLRASPTLAETVLWNAIRSRQLGGFKFRRQHVIAGFVADFYCPAAGLVVEVGRSHEGRESYDTSRDETFSQLGVVVMRVSNDAVRRNLASVLNSILRYCVSRVGVPL